MPYRLLEVVERVPERECTLADVESLARRLFARHQAQSGLGTQWTFGFDLSTARAGVCRYRETRIDLSVSYCLRATRADIENTLLHEIAHAIVGAGTATTPSGRARLARSDPPRNAATTWPTPWPAGSANAAANGAGSGSG